MPKQVGELLSAIEEIRPDRQEREARAPAKASVLSSRRFRLAGAVAAVVAAAFLIAGAWLYWGREPASAAETPTLAVLPFADLSPQRDKAYFAEGVAEAILTMLAKEPGIQVIGRSTAEQLQDAGAEADEMRRELGVTHVLEGSARASGDQLRMSVRLINAADGRQLWAEEFQRRLDNVFAVQDEIGRAVARRLKGSFAGSANAPQQLTSADAYSLYLAARAKMRDRRLPSLKAALADARRVLAADPDYAPGHALYAELVWHLSSENYGTLPSEKARAISQRHARRAIQLAPNEADGYAALGISARGRTAVEALSKAIHLDPGRGELRLWLANELELMGREEEALGQLIAALELDPLLVPLVARHAYVLAASERLQDAEAAITKFERNGGSAGVANRMRADIAGFIQGDYSEAARLALAALAVDPQTPLAAGSLAGAYSMLGMPHEARKYARDMPLYTRLALADSDGLLAQVRRDGAGIWEQSDADVAIRALAEQRDWAALEALFDANSQALDLICSTPRFWIIDMGLNLAHGLKARGRERESNLLLTCIKRLVASQTQSEIRSAYLPNSIALLAQARIAALLGEGERAFVLLNAAISKGFRTAFETGLSNYAEFDRYRDSQAYKRLDSRLRQLISKERAEGLQLSQAT